MNHGPSRAAPGRRARPRRGSLLVACALLVAALAGPHRAAAQQDEVTSRIRRARPAQVVGAFALGAGSYAFGAGLAYASSAGCHGDSEDAGAAYGCLPLPAAIALVGAVGVLLTPPLMSYAIGKRRDVHGNVGLAILGSGVGVLLAIAPLTGLARATEPSPAALIALGGLTVVTLTTTGAVLGYNASARARARRAILPTPGLAPSADRRGLLLTLGARF